MLLAARQFRRPGSQKWGSGASRTTKIGGLGGLCKISPAAQVPKIRRPEETMAPGHLFPGSTKLPCLGLGVRRPAIGDSDGASGATRFHFLEPHLAQACARSVRVLEPHTRPQKWGQRFSAFFAFHLVPKMGVSILAEEFVLLFQHFSGRRVCPGSTFWNRIWPTRGAAWGTIFCAISGPFEIRCRALPAAQRRTPRPPQPPQTPNFRGAASA